MATTAWIKKYEKYAIVATIFAISIPLATLYFGVHWLMDILFGEIFAIAAVAIAFWLNNKI
jgi:membrane-associated phospholipid phosphatase